MIRAPFDRTQVLLPRVVPDLEVVVDTRDDDVPAEPGVSNQGGWHEDAPVLVELRRRPRRRRRTAQLTRLAGERVESGKANLDRLAPGVAG